MMWSDWPQWLAIFWIAFPVIAWPMARAAGLVKTSLRDWFAKYIGMVISRGLIAFVLHAGGFWA